MDLPIVLPRIEQRDDRAGLRINAGNVRTLVSIAVNTAKGEVVRDRKAAVFPREYVIDLKGFRNGGFAEQAVLAPSAGAPPT